MRKKRKKRKKSRLRAVSAAQGRDSGIMGGARELRKKCERSPYAATLRMITGGRPLSDSPFANSHFPVPVSSASHAVSCD